MIIGHEKIIKIFEREMAGDKLSQAYLFAGPENVGKKTVALWLAKKILKDENLESSPNFIMLEPERTEKDGIIKKGEIKIEQVRELQHCLGLSSFGGGHKIAIIDEAEKMNKSSQNSLLKTLEEPHEKNTVILITSEPKKILATITSRCRKKKFSLVSEKEIEKMIPDNLDKKAILFWSFDRPGSAQKLVQNPKEMEFYGETFKEFKSLFGQTVSEKFLLAEKMSKDAGMLMRKLSIWMMILRIPLLGINDKIKIAPKKSLEIMEEIEKTIKTLRETNAGARLTLENLFLKF